MTPPRDEVDRLAATRGRALAHALAIRLREILFEDDSARSVDGDLVMTIERMEVREPVAGWLRIDGYGDDVVARIVRSALEAVQEIFTVDLPDDTPAPEVVVRAGRIRATFCGLPLPEIPREEWLRG